MTRHSIQAHIPRRRQARNNGIVCTTFPDLLADYRLRDIFTIDVTELEVFWSPVAGESIEETCNEILSTNADATEKMQPIVVVVASAIT